MDFSDWWDGPKRPLRKKPPRRLTKQDHERQGRFIRAHDTYSRWLHKGEGHYGTLDGGTHTTWKCYVCEQQTKQCYMFTRPKRIALCPPCVESIVAEEEMRARQNEKKA